MEVHKPESSFATQQRIASRRTILDFINSESDNNSAVGSSSFNSRKSMGSIATHERSSVFTFNNNRPRVNRTTNTRVAN